MLEFRKVEIFETFMELTTLKIVSLTAVMCLLDYTVKAK